MPDGERAEILHFKQPQQQVARFADSTCPATPGRAHRLHGTCTLDPGRASGGVTESEDVPVGAGRVLWTLDELPGELRSQKTCPPGRQCGPAWVYEDAWSQHSSYSPAATTPLDKPLQRTSPSAIRWCPQGPGRACSAARRAPGQPDVPAGQPGCTCLGVRRCQHPAPSCSPAAAEDGPLDELQLQTSRQRRQMWGLDSQGVPPRRGEHRRTSQHRLLAFIGRQRIHRRTSQHRLLAFIGRQLIHRRTSLQRRRTRPPGLGSRGREPFGPDQLRDRIRSGGEPCYGRGIRELGRSKSASSTHVQICE